jgi:hypothetical protein
VKKSPSAQDGLNGEARAKPLKSKNVSNSNGLERQISVETANLKAAAMPVDCALEDGGFTICRNRLAASRATDAQAESEPAL